MSMLVFKAWKQCGFYIFLYISIGFYKVLLDSIEGRSAFNLVANGNLFAANKSSLQSAAPGAVPPFHYTRHNHVRRLHHAPLVRK